MWKPSGPENRLRSTDHPDTVLHASWVSDYLSASVVVAVCGTRAAAGVARGGRLRRAVRGRDTRLRVSERPIGWREAPRARLVDPRGHLDPERVLANQELPETHPSHARMRK